MAREGAKGAPEGTCPGKGGREGGLRGDRLLSSSCQDEQGSGNAIILFPTPALLVGDSET